MPVLKYRATDGTIQTLPIITNADSGVTVEQDLLDTVEQHTQDIEGLETQTAQLTTAVGAINDSLPTKYSAINPPPYPVTSVNGQTGDVTINTGSTPILEDVQCNSLGGGSYGYKGALALNKIAFARVHGGSSGYNLNAIVCIHAIDDPDYNITFKVYNVNLSYEGGNDVYTIEPADNSYLNFYVGGFA